MQLPRGNELLAVHELSQRLIREGDIEDAATLLDLFLGIYQEEGSLVLQLGGRREAERDYLSEAKAREIPGVAELLEDSGKWWPLRSSDDPTAQGIMNLVGGAIAQELHAEQILGP